MDDIHIYEYTGIVMDSDISRTYHTPCRNQAVMISASFVVRVIIIEVVMVAVAVAIVVGVKALVWAGAVVNTSVKVSFVAALTDVIMNVRESVAATSELNEVVIDVFLEPLSAVWADVIIGVVSGIGVGV